MTDKVEIDSEPTDAVLRCMAITYDHGLGCPGYYDQELFGGEPGAHEKRLEDTMNLMRKLYQDVVWLNSHPEHQAQYQPGGRFGG